MRETNLHGEIEVALQQLEALREQSGALPEAQKPLAEGFEELSLSLPRLLGLAGELHQQKEELAETRGALEADCQRYQDLLDLIPEAYLLTDTRGVIQKANRAAAALLLITQDHLVGKSLLVFVAEKDRRIFESQLVELTQLERGRDWEACLQPAGGASFPALVTAGAWHDSSSRLVGLSWRLNDVRREKALEQKWKTYEFIANTAKEFMTLIGTDYVYEAVNDSYCRAHNKTRAEIIGKTVADVWGQERFETIIKQHLDKCFAGDEVHDQSWFDFASLGPRYFDVAYYPYFGNNEFVTHAAVVSHDFTEYMRAEEALRRNQEELERRVEERTAELAKANCEIRKEIAEREQVEQALQASGRRYKRLLESVTDYIYSVKVQQGRAIATSHSSACVALTGYTAEEYEADPYLWYRLIYEEDRNAVTEQAAKVLASETVSPLEHRLIHKDGSVRWVRNTAVPQYDHQGHVVAYDGLISDITERKRVETTLREERNLLRTLIDNLPDYIYIKDTEGRYVDNNVANVRALGAPMPDELVGKTDLDIFPPELAAQYYADDQEVLRSGQPLINREERAIDPQGRKQWLLTTKVPVRDSQGQIVRLVGISRDITKRKRAEQALQESETRFRTLAETTHAAIFIFQGTQRLYVNPAAEAISGYSNAELLAMNFWEVIHPDFRDLVRNRGLAGQHGEPVPPRYEIKILTKSGDERWVDFSGEMIQFEGRPAVLGTAFDITERKQAELERERLLAAEREQRLLAETLREEAFELNRKLMAVQVAGAVVASSLDLKYILDAVTSELINLLEVEDCAISKWDHAADTILVMAQYNPAGWREKDSADRVCNLADYPATKQVLVERRAQQMTVSQPDIDPAELAFMQKNRFKTLLMLPMEFQDRVVGLVEMVARQVERTFTPDEIALAQLLTNQAAISVENAQLYEQARQELAERTRVEQELHQVIARNRAILDAIPDSMFCFSREGELLDLHVVTADVLSSGILGRPAIGKNLTEMLPPVLAASAVNYIEQTLDSVTIEILEYQLALPLGSQDFEMRFVTSGPNEVLTIVRNITDRKQAQQQIIRAERLAALGRLAVALAHEIRNPLQAIRSHLDLLLKYSLEAADKEVSLDIIDHQIERLNSLAEHMLDYAQPKPVLRQQVVLTDLVQQVLALTGKRLEQTGIQVITDFRDVPAVLAAPNQLTQVLLNLVNNAIEAVSQSDSQLHIAIYPDGDDVAISFTSDAPAIPAEILPHIFDPFFTTKSEGSGLGLWVSYSLVEQHSGSLAVKNVTDEKGVIITVVLPRTGSLGA